MNLLDLAVVVSLNDQVSDKIGKLKSVIGLGITKAATAGVKAVGSLSKEAVNAYADYEQLVGGVDTLFSNLDGTVSSSSTVLSNASKAYQTAGLSANEYMETVTGFAAALVSSLKGDYSKAAEIADMAVRDMSDNANKMGTSMESIQNAYQGFAKQNYTMLDNLKLGYGGTKEEMQRLIKDANRIAKAQGINTRLSIKNYDDIVEAIHIVQENMGIAGTTQEEAAKTISGSLNSTKAAWANLVAGLADENSNFSELIGNLVESASAFEKNIMPRVSQALNGIVELIKGLAPTIISILPQLIADVLPTLISCASLLVTTLVSTIVDNFPLIIDVGIQALTTLFDSIDNDLPNMIPKIVMIVTQIITTITNNLPTIVKMGVTLLAKLAIGIIQNLPQIALSAVSIIDELLTSLANMTADVIDAGMMVVDFIVQGIADTIDMLIPYGARVVDNIKAGIQNAWSGLVSWFKGLWNSLFGNLTANIKVTKSDSTGSPHASGLETVPYNGYMAMLHKGEAVLTAKEAAEWRSGQSGKNVTVNVYPQSMSQAEVNYLIQQVNRQLGGALA